MRTVFASVTLEDLYGTCVCQCYIGGFVRHMSLPILHLRICMRPVFANVT